MKKYILDLTVTQVSRVSERYVLITTTHAEPLPPMQPGQFAQLRVDGSKETFLRRPISLHMVDYEQNTLSFLVATIGEGTRHLGQLRPGDVLNAVLPLGRGFTMPQSASERILLVGGGVGIAPLLYMGAQMKAMGCTPTFLLGARTASDFMSLQAYEALGPVYITTEDGSLGEKGFVTQHSLLQHESFTRISTCGPKPMMMAVARYAKQTSTPCEVSLENLMACGVGACLCCVEDTQEGHVCVCKEGPVFKVEDLKWQI